MSDLPRDTPVDTPAVQPPGGALIEAPDLGPDAAQLGARALSRARSVETLEAGYEAWMELRQAYALAQRRWKEERERLAQQGALLLGAVRAAGGAPQGPESAGLAKPGELEGFLAEAKTRLDAAQRQLDERVSAADETFKAELLKLRDSLRERVERQASFVKPVFRLAMRTLPGDRRILHAHRLRPDETVLVLFALTRRIPSRHDFLLDDSTDDVTAAPPVLYPDEGVTELRPKPTELASLLRAREHVWPVKGILPLVFPDGTWMRWVSRGAVLEAEVADGDDYRSALTAAEAERVTGLLLAHKLAGRIELELVRD